jgi:ketosteroid isomerase-like protein
MKKERLEAADVARIYRLWNEYAEAINTENMEQWRELWSNGSFQLTSDVPQIPGKEQFQKFLHAQSDQYDSIFSINPEVVCILGDQAYTYGSFKTILTLKEGGDKTEIQRIGMFLTILEKQADGSWKILIDCFNDNEAAKSVGLAFNCEREVKN